jgi:hypothetical protein
VTAPLIKFGDLIWVNTATTGTGTVTLGAAVSGYLSFANGGISDGDKVTYTLHDGANSEIGRGTYTASGTTLSRDRVYHSTNGNAAINLSGSATITVEPAQTDYKLVTAMGAGLRMINGTVVASVAANALTLAVKTLAGTDASPLDPVIFVFRNPTAATGDYLIRRVEAALSITIASGATLGHASARDQQIILGAIDNAGTVELFVRTAMPDEATRLVSTTTMSGAATSPSVAYSTTGRANLAWIPVARCVSNQTTAGAWTLAPAQLDLAPFRLPTNFFSVSLSGAEAVTNSVSTKITFNNVIGDPDGTWDAVTNFRHQPKVAGKYQYNFSLAWVGPPSGAQCLAMIFKNGGRTFDSPVLLGAGAVSIGQGTCAMMDMNGTSDYAEIFALWFGTGTTNVAGSLTSQTWFNGHRVGP